MEELHYLGSLLGLPSISDPLFPLAYTNFFGSIPGMEDTPPEPQDMDTIDRANVRQLDMKVHIHISSLFVCLSLFLSLPPLF